MEVMESGSLRYQKNWFRKERMTHDTVPRTHIRKVSTGMDGSSPTGTVRATCSTGELSFGEGEAQEEDGMSWYSSWRCFETESKAEKRSPSE